MDCLATSSGNGFAAQILSVSFDDCLSVYISNKFIIIC